MDPITEYIIQEGSVLSDKDIAVRLSEFESGKNNKLLIFGVSGAGKTTLGEMLSKRYKVKWISLDSMWWRLKQKYFKNVDENKEELRKKVLQFATVALKSNERLIIEGVDLLDIYKKNPKLITKHSMIILGLSSLRAGIRAGIRNVKRGGEGWKELYWMPKINLTMVEPVVKKLRKDVSKMPDAKITGYEV